MSGEQLAVLAGAAGAAGAAVLELQDLSVLMFADQRYCYELRQG